MSFEIIDNPPPRPAQDPSVTWAIAAVAVAVVFCVLVFAFIPMTVIGITLGVNANVRKADATQTLAAVVVSQTAYAKALSTQAAMEALPADAKDVFIEAFDTNTHYWQSLRHDGESGGYTTGQLKDGQYTYSAFESPRDYVWFSIPDTYEVMPPSFYMSVYARQIAGEPDSGYGLVFNVSSERWVSFEVAENGYFEVFSKKGDTGTSLTYWTRLSAIHQGKWNRLSVREENGHTQFFINQALAYETDAILPPNGSSGVVIEAADGSEQSFQFDNFSIYSLDK